MAENITEELSEGDLEFLKDFMNISEALMFNHNPESSNSNINNNGNNISASDIAIVPAEDGPGDIQVSMDLDTREDTFDFLGVVIFVVCGHFFIKWFLAFFPCLTNCLVPRSNPVRSLKFLYLLFSNLVIYSCLCISFGALQAENIGYFSANLFVSLGCLFGVESVAVYVTIVEFGEILRSGSSGSSPINFDEEAVVVSMPTTPDGSGSDMPPSYEEAMAAKQQQQQQEEQQQQQQQQRVTPEDATTLNALPYTR